MRKEICREEEGEGMVEKDCIGGTRLAAESLQGLDLRTSAQIPRLAALRNTPQWIAAVL